MASGGHSQVVHVRGWGDYEVLGATIDDAAGEAFDEVVVEVTPAGDGGDARTHRVRGLVLTDDDGGEASSASESKPSSGLTSGSEGKGSTKLDPSVMKGSQMMRIKSTRVYVPIPPGWSSSKRGLYHFAESDDGHAMLAFTVVATRGQLIGRKRHAERTFNIFGCKEKPPKTLRIGPNKLKATFWKKSCNLNGRPSFVTEVLINQGRRSFPFVIFAVDDKASKKTRQQAAQILLRIERR